MGFEGKKKGIEEGTVETRKYSYAVRELEIVDTSTVDVIGIGINVDPHFDLQIATFDERSDYE